MLVAQMEATVPQEAILHEVGMSLRNDLRLGFHRMPD